MRELNLQMQALLSRPAAAAQGLTVDQIVTRRASVILQQMGNVTAQCREVLLQQQPHGHGLNQQTEQERILQEMRRVSAAETARADEALRRMTYLHQLLRDAVAARGQVPVRVPVPTQVPSQVQVIEHVQTDDYDDVVDVELDFEAVGDSDSDSGDVRELVVAPRD